MKNHFHSRVVIDIASGDVIERVSVSYEGAWELVKGDNSQAEMAQANQVSQQQLLQQQQQFQLQQQQFNMVNPGLQAIIQNGGMLPAQQAAMTSQALNGLGSQYQNLYGQLSQSLAARGITGGQNAGAGAIAQGFGSLGAAEAGQQSQLLNQIQLAKGQGLQQAFGTALGEGSIYGSQATSLGSQGVSALGSGVTAANNADQAQTGFFGSLIGGLAGLGGSGLGAAGNVWCWVAGELYGMDSPERSGIIYWLACTPAMQPFLWLYRRIGPRWAAAIRRNPQSMLKRFSMDLFDLFLRAANGRY